MRKKTIKILCALVLLIQLFAAAAESQGGGKSDGVYIDLLLKLGVIDKEDDGTFAGDKEVTRAEFAGMIAKLNEDKSVLYEIPEDLDGMPQAQAIAQLMGDGVIDKDISQFRPDESITGNEAVKMLVALLGYDVRAQNSGAYPAGYIVVANEIGLFKSLSLSGNKVLLQKDAVRLIFNSLDVHLLKQTSIGDNIDYDTDDSGSMMNEWLGLYKESGIITANAFVDIEGHSKRNKNYVSLNGNEYQICGTDAEALVGCYVDCYYHWDENSDERKIVFISNVDKKMKQLTIQAEDIIKFSQGYFYYHQNDEEEKIHISTECAFILNGARLDVFDEYTFLIDNGKITFIDNDNDGLFDVAKIFSYTNMFVDTITQEKIYDSFEVTRNIALKGNNIPETIRVYDAEGNTKELKDIRAQNVLSVYRSDKLLEIVISNQSVKGTIKAIRYEGNKKLIDIDGKEYEMDVNFERTTSDELKLGETGTFYMDRKGKLVTMTSEGDSMYRYGYIIKASKTNEGIKNKLEIKILDQSSEVKTLQCSDNILIDGVKTAYDKATLPQVNKPVVYKLNSNNEITMLDTIISVTPSGDNPDDRLKLKITGAAGRFKSATRIFEGHYAIDQRAKVFVVPVDSDKAEDEDYYASGYSYFGNDVSYGGLEAYTVSREDKLTWDIVIVRRNISSNNGNVMVVKKVVESVNTSGDKAVRIYGYLDGVEVSYVTETAAVGDKIVKITAYGASNGDASEELAGAKIEPGDIIKCAMNKRSEIRTISLVFDASENKVVSVNPYFGDFHDPAQRYVYGTVTRIYEGIAELNYGSTYDLHNIGVSRVMIYNKANNRFYQGSMNDIQEGTSIFAVSYGGLPNFAIIYTDEN